MTTRLIDTSYAELHPTIRALSDAGLTRDDATWIRKGRGAARVAAFIRKEQGLVHVFDCDAEPMKEYGRKVSIMRHKKSGLLDIARERVELHSATWQRGEGEQKVIELEKVIDETFVLNASALDCYLAHQELIPEEWKEYQVFFLGTIYSDTEDNLLIRYLSFSGHFWHSAYRCVTSIGPEEKVLFPIRAR